MQKQQDYFLLLLLVHMQGPRSAEEKTMKRERAREEEEEEKKKEKWRCLLLVSLRDMTVVRRCRLPYPIHLRRILLFLSCSSFQLMDKQKCCC